MTIFNMRFFTNYRNSKKIDSFSNNNESFNNVHSFTKNNDDVDNFNDDEFKSTNVSQIFDISIVNVIVANEFFLFSLIKSSSSIFKIENLNFDIEFDENISISKTSSTSNFLRENDCIRSFVSISTNFNS